MVSLLENCSHQKVLISCSVVNAAAALGCTHTYAIFKLSSTTRPKLIVRRDVVRIWVDYHLESTVSLRKPCSMLAALSW